MTLGKARFLLATDTKKWQSKPVNGIYIFFQFIPRRLSASF
jgi:hypothetical protein